MTSFLDLLVPALFAAAVYAPLHLRKEWLRRRWVAEAGRRGWAVKNPGHILTYRPAEFAFCERGMQLEVRTFFDCRPQDESTTMRTPIPSGPEWLRIDVRRSGGGGGWVRSIGHEYDARFSVVSPFPRLVERLLTPEVQREHHRVPVPVAVGEGWLSTEVRQIDPEVLDWRAVAELFLAMARALESRAG